MRPLFFLLVCLFTAVPKIVEAEELRVDVTEGRVEPMPVAVLDFYGADQQLGVMGKNIANVIAADLERSGLFRPIEKSSYIQNALQPNDPIRFGDWRLINAQILLKGQISAVGDGRLRVEFRLYDVYSEKQMAGFAFTASSDQWRRMAHKVSDYVYKRVTGEEGYFDTKIVYVSLLKSGRRRIEKLAIMDQDGANHRFLTDGRALVLSPRFSPNMEHVVYMSMPARKQPHVHLMRLSTQQDQVLGKFKGMTYAPRFSPDGRRVIFAYAQEGTSNLYMMDLMSREVRQLTTDRDVIDTSPCFSNDGSQIVFVSDRGGKPQLYVMGAGDFVPKRISFGEGKYYTPVWSPRGDLIAFTKMHKGIFSIGVMRPDGTGERLITQGYMVEAPTWAPNGRVLMYNRQERNGVMKLCSIDVTGYNERVVSTPYEAMLPSWSPLIP